MLKNKKGKQKKKEKGNGLSPGKTLLSYINPCSYTCQIVAHH
jgi:hypothetical protein